MAGKLKGQMAATTPRGSRYDLVSISFATSNTSPVICVVIPQAVSATCRPRRTSPFASAIVLPCSSVMLAARRSQFSLINATYLNISCCLCRMLVAFHAGKAASALSTAALSSASVLCGTLVTRLFVAGSWRSIHWVAWDWMNLLSRKFVVSMGWETFSWEVGYSVADVASDVAVAWRCCVVACSLRTAILPEFNDWGIAATRRAELATDGRRERLWSVLVDKARRAAMLSM